MAEKIIDDPRQAALDEVVEEEKQEKEGIAKEDIKKKDAPGEEETVEEKEKREEEEAAEAEQEEAKEAKKKELSKQAKELGLEEDATEEDIETAKEEKAAEKATERKEKTEKLGLKEEATDDEITEAETKAAKEALEKEVKEFAESENVTLDQARKHLEGIDGVLKKYENNPKKLAKAYRSQQSEFSRLQAENAQLKIAKPKVVTLGEDEIAIGDKVFSKAKVVKAYKDQHPAETEDLEDNQVLLMARTAFEAQVNQAYNEYEKELAGKAVIKRTQLIDNLGEGDKKFLSEIKEGLGILSDEVVMREDFDISDVTKFVKGDKYEEAVKTHKEELKAEYARGLKAGKEGAKIKIPAGTPPKGKGKTSLSDSETREALRMYGNAMTEDEAIEAFKETGLKEFREENKR